MLLSLLDQGSWISGMLVKGEGVGWTGGGCPMLR